ncbi:hypothetical protein [Streptomyces aureocirculatus]|uniref:hypothetical protein n=1 Tax=Streptomyces aureocirculatus TaxID=67275 RepID=UPI0012FECA9F|nr:hypothetical protein [Streptomyces aureocirculatus]
MAIIALLVGLCAPAANAQSRSGGTEAGSFTITNLSGEPATDIWEAPQNLKERMGRRQAETPHETHERNSYVQELQRKEKRKVGPRQAGEIPPGDMSDCYKADLGDDGSKILTHWQWCKEALGSYHSFEKCQGPPPGNGCVEIGSVQFRVAVMGQGYQDKNDPGARKVRYWMQLDNPKIFLLPRLTDQLSFTGRCESFTPGGPCQAAASNGRIDTIAGWMQAGHARWDYSSPEGSISDPDKKAFFNFTMKSTVHQDYDISGDVVEGGEAGFRCDSARYQLWPVDRPSYGCVFDGVNSIWNFKAKADVAETARHVWTAQFKPNQTRPPSVQDKKIPGSIKSYIPLSRLAGTGGSENKILHEKNRSKSIANCKTNYGVSYSRSKTRDCDEYPMASTREGAFTGDVEDEDGTSHFSVKAIPKDDNQQAGRDLVDSTSTSASSTTTIFSSMS